MSIFDDAKASKSGKVGRILGSANASNSAAVMAKEGARGTPPVKHRVDNESHAKMAGKKSKERFDRPARAKGGAVRAKGKTNVTVIVAPQGAGQPPQVAVGGTPPMMSPGAGAPPMAPDGPGAVPAMPPRPPMAGPGASPPGMPMRKRGGAVMKAGAGSGVGRLEKL